jgi:thymidylate kinase
MEIQTSDKKTKKKLISISGLDGSGKSTFINLLQKDIKGVIVVHMVDFRIVNRLFKILFGSKKKTKSTLESKERQSGGATLLSIINLSLLFFDLIYLRMFCLFQSNPVLMDRYFYDLYISHCYRYRSNMFVKALLAFTPKPDIAIFLDVDGNVAQKRESDDYHEIGYFTRKREMYFSELPANTFKVIKNENIDSTYTQIKAHLFYK